MRFSGPQVVKQEKTSQRRPREIKNRFYFWGTKITVFWPIFFKKSVKTAVPDDGRPPRALVLTKLVDKVGLGSVDFWCVTQFWFLLKPMY